MQLHVILPGEPVDFPEELASNPHGIVALGGRLTPEGLMRAYRRGVFPWTGEHPIPWFSPDPRMVLVPSQVRVTRSLRQTLQRGEFVVRVDHDFEAMIDLCANIPRPGQDGTWITPNMRVAWVALHRMGRAHSVEVYRDGALAGGLYGMALGSAFFGESMASRVRDASKVALVTLCRHLERLGFAFIDCQQATAHLGRMGGVTWPRGDYLERVAAATAGPELWAPYGA